MPLRASDFGVFFKDVHGHPPYKWQSELAEHVCERGWPPALNMPTGTGKTAAIDVAVFHLAAAAHKKSRDASMRIAYVIDRRLVVDGAFDHAWRLAEALRVAAAERRGGHSAAGRVASALLKLSYSGRPLDAVRLRGGMVGENDWAKTPAQPTVIVSTIDQVGSRLLFRGYGVSDSMRPVHAGLLGSDTLFLLDEAHLSQPFADTLKTISGLSSKFANACSLKYVSMSATIPNGDAFPSGGQRDAALRDGRLSSILAAHKYVELRGPSKSVVDELVGAARALSGPDRVRNVGIVVNRVSTARKVFSLMKSDMEKNPDGARPHDVHLLTGRARPYDRDRLVEEELGRIGSGRQDTPSGEGGKTGGNRTSRNGNARLTFYVATQCIEVGVDISFDALATQIAPIDSLVQRFGRLNRRGGLAEAHAVIVAGSDDVKDADPIYGGAVARTWKYLKNRAESGVLDFGANHFEAIPPDAMKDMRAPVPDGATLLPEYTRLWAQTSPAPDPDPTPSLFLHGRQSGPPDVQVVWRADITGDMLRNGERERYLRTFTTPPSPLEAVSVPIWAAKKWLSGASNPDVADVEGGTERADGARGGARGRRLGAIRWRGRKSPYTRVVGPDDVAPGDTIVVPAEYGGCDRYGWGGGGDPVTDIATEANLAYRRRISLRFDGNLLESYRMRTLNGTDADRDGDPTVRGGNGGAWAAVKGVLAEHADLYSRKAFLDDLMETDGLPGIWRAALSVIRNGGMDVRVERAVDGGAEWICGLESKGRVTRKQCERILGSEIAEGEGDGSEASTDDESGTGSGSGRIDLMEHCMGVRSIVERFGSLVGMSDALTRDLMAAGRLHDAGKAEPRVQALLQGKDADEPLDGPPVAKSTVGIPDGAEYRRRLGLARLPEKYRHERWSVSLARNHPLLRKARDRDLVLYLIGTHHGYGRPLFPVTGGDPDYAGGGLEFDGVSAVLGDPVSWIDPDWIDMCERLYERYGLWNVAYMESVLRLADHRQSEGEHAGD